MDFYPEIIAPTGDMQTLLFVNEFAHKGKAKKFIKEYKETLAGFGWHEGRQYAVAQTRPNGETIEQARQLVRRNWKRVMVLAGDGGQHEVANGVIEETRLIQPATPLERLALGLLPAGTSCDNAQSIGMEHDPIDPTKGQDYEQWAHTTIRGGIQALDALHIDGKIWSIDSIGWGYEPKALKDRVEMKDKLPWPLSLPTIDYTPAAIKNAASRAVKARIIIDGNESKVKIYSAHVQNTSVYAGSVHFYRTNAFDGIADFYYVSNPADLVGEVATQGIKRLVRLLSRRVAKGVDELIRNYKHIPGKEMHIRFEKPMESQIDGEIYETKKEFHVKSYAGVLNVIVPPRG